MFIRWIALPPAAPHAKLCRMPSSKAIIRTGKHGISALKTLQNKWGKHGKTMESIGKPWTYINICQDNIIKILKKLDPLTFEHLVHLGHSTCFRTVLMDFDEEMWWNLEESPEVAAERIWTWKCGTRLGDFPMVVKLQPNTSSIKLDRVGWEKIWNFRPFGGKHAHEDHEGFLINEEFISVLRVQIRVQMLQAHRPTAFQFWWSFLRWSHCWECAGTMMIWGTWALDQLGSTWMTWRFGRSWGGDGWRPFLTRCVEEIWRIKHWFLLQFGCLMLMYLDVFGCLVVVGEPPRACPVVPFEFHLNLIRLGRPWHVRIHCCGNSPFSSSLTVAPAGVATAAVSEARLLVKPAWCWDLTEISARF